MKPSALAIGFLIIFISVFTLFFIFDYIIKIGNQCSTQQLEICQKFKGLSMPLVLIVLMVSVLSLVASSVFYIMVTLR